MHSKNISIWKYVLKCLAFAVPHGATYSSTGLRKGRELLAYKKFEGAYFLLS